MSVWKDKRYKFFEAQNVPLYPDTDTTNPLNNIIIDSIINQKNLVGELIYYTSQHPTSLNVASFHKYVSEGRLGYSYPTFESSIIQLNQSDLLSAVSYHAGTPCTVLTASVDNLTVVEWVRFWLQENKGFNAGLNQFGDDYVEVKTDPATTSSSSNLVAGSPNIELDLTDSIATSDEVNVDERWFLDLNNIIINSNDTYTASIYNLLGETKVLPYSIPSKDLDLFVFATYSKNSNPNRQYIFLYEIGSGTYPALDNTESTGVFNTTGLRVFPSISLRHNNLNYNHPDSEQLSIPQIEGACNTLGLNASELIDAVMEDVGPDELETVDDVFIRFAIRLLDTSQASVEYLYNFFLKLYGAQIVTEEDYNAAVEANIELNTDSRSQAEIALADVDFQTTPFDEDDNSNIIDITADRGAAFHFTSFRFSYITYTFFPKADIDLDTNSIENGIYYNDLSKFDSSGTELIKEYYISGVATAGNSGFIASTQAEVNAFINGTGRVNPRASTGDAANKLSVTRRIRYDALRDLEGEPYPGTNYLKPGKHYFMQDGYLVGPASIIELIDYYEPEISYVIDGNGDLVPVESEGDPIYEVAFYKATPSGLHKYLVRNPRALALIEDADSGEDVQVTHFLDRENDVAVPLVYEYFLEVNIQNRDALFQSSIHITIYLADYQVVQYSFFQKLLFVAQIVLFFYGTYNFAQMLGAPLSTTASASTSIAVSGTGEAVTIQGGQAVYAGTSTVVPAGTAVNYTTALGLTYASQVGIGGTLVGSSLLVSASVYGVFTNLFITALIKQILVEIADENPELAKVLAVVSFLAQPFIKQGTFTFTLPSIDDIFKIFLEGATFFSAVENRIVENGIEKKYEEFAKQEKENEEELKDFEEFEDTLPTFDFSSENLLRQKLRVNNTLSSIEEFWAYNEHSNQLLFDTLDPQDSIDNTFIFVT